MVFEGENFLYTQMLLKSNLDLDLSQQSHIFKESVDTSMVVRLR